MKYFSNYIFIILLSLSVNTLSTAQFKLSGEFRPRLLYSHGSQALVTPNQASVTFFDQRTRLNLDYKKGDITTRLSLQDVRVWGAQASLVPPSNLLSLNEGWV